MTTAAAAVEALSSEFDYFSPQVISDAIEAEYDVAVPTKSAVSRTQPLEFSIAGEERVYRDLNNSLIEVTCKITNANGTDLAAGAVVAPVNFILHALFKSCEVYVNGKRVSDPSVHYAERAYLEAVLSNDKRVLDSRTVCEGWIKDNAELMDSFILTAADDNQPNDGFVKRNKLCARSRQMTFAGRLHADLFHQPLDIPAGVPLELKLEQNRDSKVLMAAADATFALQIISARLLVRSKRLSPSLILAHQRMLASQNYRIPYTRVTTKQAIVSAGSTTMSLNDFHTGVMPNRITLCMIASTAQNGAYNQNPFNFGNFGLTELSLKVGDRNVPHEPMKMNYAIGNYTLAYLNTLSSLGIDQGDRAISINPEEWASGYNIYCFKLAPGNISTGVLHASVTEAVNVSVSGTFATALPSNVTVLAYIEHPAVLEIDQFKNVLV
jgi:hypothetical protein